MNLTETNKYITFVLVLLIWELIPTSVIIILFRIKQISYQNDVSTSIQSGISIRRSVFIDRSYNENDDNNNENDSLYYTNNDTDFDDDDEDFNSYNPSGLINNRGYYGSI